MSCNAVNKDITETEIGKCRIRQQIRSVLMTSIGPSSGRIRLEQNLVATVWQVFELTALAAGWRRKLLRPSWAAARNKPIPPSGSY